MDGAAYAGLNRCRVNIGNDGRDCSRPAIGYIKDGAGRGFGIPDQCDPGSLPFPCRVVNLSDEWAQSLREPWSPPAAAPAPDPREQNPYSRRYYLGCGFLIGVAFVLSLTLLTGCQVIHGTASAPPHPIRDRIKARQEKRAEKRAAKAPAGDSLNGLSGPVLVPVVPGPVIVPGPPRNGSAPRPLPQGL